MAILDDIADFLRQSFELIKRLTSRGHLQDKFLGFGFCFEDIPLISKKKYLEIFSKDGQYKNMDRLPHTSVIPSHVGKMQESNYFCKYRWPTTSYGSCFNVAI